MTQRRRAVAVHRIPDLYGIVPAGLLYMSSGAMAFVGPVIDLGGMRVPW